MAITRELWEDASTRVSRWLDRHARQARQTGPAARSPAKTQRDEQALTAQALTAQALTAQASSGTASTAQSATKVRAIPLRGGWECGLDKSRAVSQSSDRPPRDSCLTHTPNHPVAE